MPRSFSGPEGGRGIVASGHVSGHVWQGAPARLDRVLRTLHPEWSRATVQELISTRRVRVDNRVVWLASWDVPRGARIGVEGAHDVAVRESFSTGGFDPVWLVADDTDLLVVDKPSGLRSEPVRATDTTPNLLALAREAFEASLALAHRLDRDTSGLVVLTRPGPIRAELDEMFRVHTIVKRYEAVVHDTDALGDGGSLVHFLAADPGRRDTMRVVPRGGKKAVTDYVVTARADGAARVALWPRTGRTHQLRVQLASMGAPILGDRIYGDVATAPRLLLHAASLEIPATTGHAARRFTSPVPF